MTARPSVQHQQHSQPSWRKISVSSSAVSSRSLCSDRGQGAQKTDAKTVEVAAPGTGSDTGIIGCCVRLQQKDRTSMGHGRNETPVSGAVDRPTHDQEGSEG